MTQGFEGNKYCFAEITPDQMGVFTDKIDFLRPLLDEHDIEVRVTEDFMTGLALGEQTIEIVDDDMKSADERKVLGKIKLNNLGGLIELGPGIAIPADPFRYTMEAEKASFLVDDKGVEITYTTDTAQNLRYAADLTATTEYKVVVTTKEEDKLHEYSREKTYRCITHNGPSYHETLKRRDKAADGQENAWVVLAAKDDLIRDIVKRADLVREGRMTLEEDRALLSEELEASKSVFDDQSTENPTRLDQNRFSDVMNILDQIDATKRTNSAPNPVKQESFKIVIE